MSIQVENIAKWYGQQKALDGVSLSIGKGEIVGLLGPNGAGKSTLFKILTGYLRASSGEATVNGLSVNPNNLDYKKHIGYLPENNPLYLELYVKEYLTFCARVFNVPRTRIAEVIEQTGLTPESGKKIGQLSKGYRQRVGLAAAILHDPDVLILDEPTTGLDPNQLVEIRQLIRDSGKDKTVILSSHIMQEVEAMCDRVVIINQGKIVFDGHIDQIGKSQNQVLLVEFDYRVETVALEQLPGITSVANPDGFRYELIFDSESDMRPRVFDFAHDNGLKILSMEQKSDSLESLFAQLTTQK